MVRKKTAAKGSTATAEPRKREKQFTLWITVRERKLLKRKATRRGFERVSDYVRRRLGLSAA